MFTNITLAQGLKGAGDIVKNIAGSAGADTYQKPQDLIGTGISAALAIVGLIFLILMIYAGYLWLTSHGEEEPIKKAQKIIASSIIGFILVASAYAITVFVGKRFEVGGGGTTGESCEGKKGPGVAGCDTCQVDFPEYACQETCADEKTFQFNYCNAPGQDSLKCCSVDFQGSAPEGECDYFEADGNGVLEEEVTEEECKEICKSKGNTGCDWTAYEE